MPDPVWHGQVNGAGLLTLHQRRAFSGYLKRFAGQRVDVTVRKASSKRSVRQNAWIFRSLRILADDWGYDAHEIDDIYHDVEIEFSGETVTKGGHRVPRERIKHMTTVRCGEFMEWLCRFAAENGVVLELPDDIPIGE